MHFPDCRLAPRTIRDLVSRFQGELLRRHRRTCQMAVGQELDLLAWGRQYLAPHFTRPPSAMHRWLSSQLDRMRQARGVKINVLGPRGAAKSTLGAMAYPLRAALERSESYIWIVSDTRPQACAHLENIKRELAENTALAEAYGDAAGAGPVWRSGTAVLRNGARIDAFGTGQSIRGRRWRAYRPTLIVCDDLQNDGHMQSARQRDRCRTWFEGTLLKAGTARTNFVNLATALHREALALELCRNPGWTSGVFQAILHWPDNMSLWQQWEAIYCNAEDTAAPEAAAAFYHAHRSEMDAGAEVLWPEEEDLYTLMCMRAEGGRTAFEREKQNRPISAEMCEWPEDYFAEHVWFEAWPAQCRVKTIALDPSKGSDANRGDYSAIVMLGVDGRGVLYIEADLARRPTPQIVADAVEWCRRFRPDAFGVEANQFQDLLADELAAEFRRQGMLNARPWAIDNRVSKAVRIRRLGPYLAARRLRFKSDSPSTRLLVEQLKEFPAGEHDDGPDAAEMAIRLAAEHLGSAAPCDGLGKRLVLEG